MKKKALIATAAVTTALTMPAAASAEDTVEANLPGETTGLCVLTHTSVTQSLLANLNLRVCRDQVNP